MNTIIEFGASPFGPALTSPGSIGDRLMDICDEVGAPIPFSCRSSSCGTCLVEVFEGQGRLSPMEAEEKLVLSLLGRAADTSGPPRYRLACQAVVVSDGRIRLRMV